MYNCELYFHKILINFQVTWFNILLKQYKKGKEKKKREGAGRGA